MFQWFDASPPPRPKSRVSPFLKDSFEAFATPMPCRVTRDISVWNKGRVMANGYSWRAELSLKNADITLLAGQPALALGQRGIALVVIPYHCPIST